MSCRPTYDPCLDSKLNQIGSYASVARQSAQSATTSATQSANSATNAATSATSAQSNATLVQNIYDDFSEKYLGSFDTPPVTTQEGALYFDTVANSLYVWNGTNWVALPTGFNEFTNFPLSYTTPIPASNFRTGLEYQIVALGSPVTNWLAIGAASATVGERFTKNSTLATGNGTARVTRDLNNRFADVVNVKDFGAIGDGVADDKAAIQAAIDAIQNTPEFFNYGGCVVLPSGKYKISDSIIINKNISIIGDGVEIIGNIFSSSKKCAFYIGSPSYIGTNDGWYKVFVEGILFNVTGHESCIFIQGIRTIKINKCVFYGGSIASVLTEECWAASSIQNCQFWNGAAKAILLRDYSNGFLISNNRIGNYNTINEVTVFVRNSSGVWIQNNDFEYNYAQITFYPTFANGCNNSHIENNWVEGSIGHSVRIDNELQGLKGVTIRGNSFYGTPDGGVYLGIFGGVGEINGAIIDGNTFNTPSQLYRNSILTRYINISSKNNFPDSSNIKCPAFRVIKSGTQAILSNAWTKITWGIENYDRGSFFSGNLWNP
jgi:hypothetical protein